MSATDPIDVVRRYLDAANAGDLEALAALQAPGFVHHSGAGDLDADGVRQGLTYYRTAFPDLVYDAAEMWTVDGGSAVVARWTMRGTHRGPFNGAAPTGRTFASDGLSLHRITGDRIAEDWEYGDDVGVLQSLGFTVQGPPAASDASEAS